MICLWWIIFKTLFVLVGGRASSGSAEAAGGLKVGAGPNTAGAINGMVLPQLVLIQNVPAPIGANKNQGTGLPVVFPVVQQQQAGAPNLQAQANLPMIQILAFLPADPNGVNRQVQMLPVITQHVQQGAAAGNTRVKLNEDSLSRVLEKR